MNAAIAFDAICAQVDPELFFPERAAIAKARRS